MTTDHEPEWGCLCGRMHCAQCGELHPCTRRREADHDAFYADMERRYQMRVQWRPVAETEDSGRLM